MKAHLITSAIIIAIIGLTWGIIVNPWIIVGIMTIVFIVAMYSAIYEQVQNYINYKKNENRN